MVQEDDFDYKKLIQFWNLYTGLTGVALIVCAALLNHDFFSAWAELFIIGFSIAVFIKIVIGYGLSSKRKLLFRQIAFATLLLVISVLLIVLIYLIAFLFTFFALFALILIVPILLYLWLTSYGIKVVKVSTLFVQNKTNFAPDDKKLLTKIKSFWIAIGIFVTHPAIFSILPFARFRFETVWQLIPVFFIYSIWIKNTMKHLNWAFLYVIIQCILSLVIFVRGGIVMFFLEKDFGSPVIWFSIAITFIMNLFLVWGVIIHANYFKNNQPNPFLHLFKKK